MKPILLLAFGGILVGGTYSLATQKAPKLAVIVCGAAAVLAVAGGIAWMF